MASEQSSLDSFMYCRSERYGKSWNGGFKRDYFLDQPIDEEQICPVCNGISREPTQTSCEHIFCRICLENSVASTEPNCPIDGKKLENSNFRDKREEKKILSKRVTCPKGCEWESALSSLEEHLLEGCKVSLKCECGQSLPRVELELHRRTKCPKRRVECQYCGEEMEADTRDSHLETCEQYPWKCSLGCGEQVTRRETEKHLEKCPNKVVYCSFRAIGCDVELIRSQHEQHLSSGVREHLHLACHAISDLRTEVSELSSQVSSSRPYVWRVQGVEEGIRDNARMASPPFYRDGYKFSAKLNLGGARQGEGTHVSVHLAVVKGANDTVLEWPIRAGSKFTVTLLNQQTDRHHVSMSRTVLPEDYPQPTDGANKFWGFNKFVSRQQLAEKTSEVEYCVRDTVYVSIQLSLLSDLPKWLRP